MSWLKSPETKKLKQTIVWHLENISDDRALRDKLEALASTQHFRALTWFWAPLLYARNRAMFRPFISQYWAQHWVPPTNSWRWELAAWEGEVAKSLDPWLVQVEKDWEVGFFRRLYEWKNVGERGWGLNETVWNFDLVQRFTAASPGNRARVLEMFGHHATLTEDSAVALYRTDRACTTAFILSHLPMFYWGEEKKRVSWSRLAECAVQAGDEDFRLKLYRRQVNLEDWTREVISLCRLIRDPAELCKALTDRHPTHLYNNVATTLVMLVEARGLDVVPYVRQHVTRVFSYGNEKPLKRLLDHARSRGWYDLWAAIVVSCRSHVEYNKAIKEVLSDMNLAETERLRRLSLLSGVSREWNGLGWGLAVVQQLDNDNALQLYKRYPELVHQSFRKHITPNYGSNYGAVFNEAWNRGDDALADYLASRYATDAWSRADKRRPLFDLVAEKYTELKLDDEAFARRAANVLTLIPAYSIYNYAQLIRSNKLARMLFERSVKSYLSSAAAIRDLVEGGEIHVQMLAYRALGVDDDRARQLAAENLDILLGTVLRPLQRKTRAAAFRALSNAAATEDGARRVLAKAREAFALPDKGYPKEALVGLIARILARHPSLATPAEQRVVYRRSA
jgi:hypothetical protein